MNRKILFVFVLLFVIPVNKTFCDTNSAITEAADKGKDLSECSDSALKEGSAYAKEHGFTEAAERMDQELARREYEKRRAAEEAERAAAEALEALLKDEKELQKIIEELAKIENEEAGGEITDSDSYEEVQQLIEEYKEKIEEDKKQLAEAADAMKKAYKELGKFYEDTQYAGDPVNIGTGEYVAAYLDYEAQDFGNKWCAIRNLSSNNYAEGFGENWTCSLASRIIRCSPGSNEKKLKLISNSRGRINNAIYRYYEYKQKFPNTTNAKLESTFNKFLQLREEYSDLYQQEYLKYCKYVEIQSKNKYVTYGRFSNPDNYYYPTDAIIYVDKVGNSCIFKYINDGKWEAISSLSAARVYIQSLDYGETPGKNSDANGGFVVIQENGFRSYFNEYGVLVKELDLNGNETLYKSEEGRITNILLKTGEELSIQYNSSNQIISISGEVSGTAEYSYNENRLSKVTGSDLIPVSYLYDEEGSLKSIIKADETSVKINYKIDELGRKVCASVTDENFKQEYFDYLPSRNLAAHVNDEDFYEHFIYDQNGRVIYKEDSAGNVTHFETNHLGLITEENINGVSYKYEYDKLFHLSERINGQGYSRQYEYDPYGNLKRMIDEDGVTYTWDYDWKGNLVASYFGTELINCCKYYDNGLLQEVYENGCIYRYEYNQYGSITKKSTYDTKNNYREEFFETWEYDNKNRVIAYTDPSHRKTWYGYGDHYKYEISPANLQTEHFYNSRMWEYKTIQTDLNTGISYTKEIIFTGKGQIEEVRINGDLFAQYSYSQSGKLKSYVIWNISAPEDFYNKHGVITVFEYDNCGRLTKTECELIKTNSNKLPIVEGDKIISRNTYSKNGEETLVMHYANNQNPYVYTYDKYGKLIKEEAPDGLVRNYKYSNAGRIISKTDSNGLFELYTYNSDGSILVTKVKQNGYHVSYEYNPFGLLINTVDQQGKRTEYSYNGQGYLLEEKTDNTFINYFYSESGELLKTIYSDKQRVPFYETEKEFTSNGVVQKNGNYIVAAYTYDAWGRPVEKESGDGIQQFEYNCIGQLTKIRNGDNKEKLISYNALGQVCYVKDFSGDEWHYYTGIDGRKVSDIKNGKVWSIYYYDEYGNITACENELGNLKKIAYDEKGNATLISNNDTGIRSISSKDGIVTITDESKRSRTKVYDLSRGLVHEINPNGDFRYWLYSDDGILQEKSNYSGKSEKFNYPAYNLTETIYEDGSKKLIKRNYADFITEMSNNSAALSFSYDEGFKLKMQSDETSELAVYYEYDIFGRLTEKKSSYFDVFYIYDENGRISEIKDIKSGKWVKITRNVQGQESKLKYSDGTTCVKAYNRLGQLNCEIYKDRIGQILKAKFLLYDDMNRISLSCDKNGLIQKYVYDNKGRIEKVFMPFSNEIYEYSLSEYINCGGFEPTDEIKGCTLELNNDEKNQLSALISSFGKNIYIPYDQTFWGVEYGYTLNGSVEYEKNPLGKIIYEYDESGRLIKKHTGGTEDFGISYKWNKDDCLILEDARYYRKSYKYGNENRPVQVHYVDYKTSKEEYTEYTYDALGRRYSEQVNNGTKIIYIYDGLSSAVLGKVPVFENGVKNTYIFNNDTSDEYRIINEIEVSNGYRENYSLSEPSSDNSDLVLYVGEGKNNYFSISNENDLTIANIYKESENITIWGSNSNLGYRDYDASMKCFTTSDPVLDGGNYFAYCATDPVNYSDMEGFRKTSLTLSEEADFFAKISDYLNFDQEEFAEGEWQNLLKEFDCADTTAFITYETLKEIGVDMTSEDLSQFKKYIEEGEIKKARELINSKSFFEEGSEDAYTQLFRGYDRNYLRNLQFSSEEKYSQEMMNREIALWYLSNPEYITPGTVLVWKSSDYTTLNDNGNWTGHTLTVLARKFDENGNIIGIAYIEGHQSIDHLTELGFMDLRHNPGVDCDLDLWFGNFLGAYEMESSEDHWEGIVKRNSCLK